MKHTIHVHQANLRQGKPAIIDRTYRGSTHHIYREIICPACGQVAATIRQSLTPDRCGARVWIEVDTKRAGV